MNSSFEEKFTFKNSFFVKNILKEFQSLKIKTACPTQKRMKD